MKKLVHSVWLLPSHFKKKNLHMEYVDIQSKNLNKWFYQGVYQAGNTSLLNHTDSIKFSLKHFVLNVKCMFAYAKCISFSREALYNSSMEHLIRIRIADIEDL